MEILQRSRVATRGRQQTLRILVHCSKDIENSSRACIERYACRTIVQIIIFVILTAHFLCWTVRSELRQQFMMSGARMTFGGVQCPCPLNLQMTLKGCGPRGARFNETTELDT